MVEWITASAPVGLPEAVAEMERRVAAIAAGREDEAVWLLEHPPVLTTGTSGKPSDILDAQIFPVHRVSRGGQVTYHGPGQRIAYLMLDLNRRGRDVRRFVRAVEGWVIMTLAEFEIESCVRPGRVGVWTLMADGSECKIAAIGIRLRRWVSFHGVSINLSPELDHYRAIIPCGIVDFGITSMRELGCQATRAQLDRCLKGNFDTAFGEAGQPVASAVPAGRPGSARGQTGG